MDGLFVYNLVTDSDSKLSLELGDNHINAPIFQTGVAKFEIMDIDHHGVESEIFVVEKHTGNKLVILRILCFIGYLFYYKIYN